MDRNTASVKRTGVQKSRVACRNAGTPAKKLIPARQHEKRLTILRKRKKIFPPFQYTVFPQAPYPFVPSPFPKDRAMITVDMHSHTLFSHAKDSAADMAAAAARAGMRVFGFSEHSPRAEGYNYTNEYRERLRAGFPEYLSQVKELRERWNKAPADAKPLRVLLGLEVDWMPNERPFIEQMIAREPSWDYLIGSVHFLGTWGFDDRQSDWDALDDDACHAKYDAYFSTLRTMAESRLMDIAAHPDLIKIFSADRFHAWIRRPEALRLIEDALKAIKESGMAMEVSAAGLRKPCAEIYPCPIIMQMAADMGIPISFASDSHCVEQVGWKFDELAAYARSFGYASSRYYVGRRPFDQPF